MDNVTFSPARHYLGVTVSSTFTDLEDHRAAAIKAILDHGMHPVAMEHDPAKPLDLIESSLEMVRNGSAYIGVIGKKYGQTPACSMRNPDCLSITELEFNEALRLGRLALLFIMGDDHLVREAHIESNRAKKKKLKAFREHAKNMAADSSVHRVYATFNSLEEFKEKIGVALADLRRRLEARPVTDGATPAATHGPNGAIPKAPEFYAEPSYIGSHNFIGRAAQLQELSDWARPANLTTVLLFEAIGGNGKSMLTWEWTNHHATNVRADWAGRFWYSFYEKGAIMADFCQRALAYMTGQPLEALRKKKTPELAKELLQQLHARPWLIILDGLERVLVAYHRIDAAEVPDEEANRPTDKIVNRDPRSAIRDEDDDLLRSLTLAAPSKVLVSSRLTPRAFSNPAGQLIPGARRISLPGLRPADAEALLRSCGITGNSNAIQSYLTTNCDCHPLVIGVLGGLINDYLPDKGDFDAWAADPDGGGRLNLAVLDLIQRRNHILRAALAALSSKSSQLLSTLALLPESIDYPTLCALNPHLPPEPEKVWEPAAPETSWRWNNGSDAEKGRIRKEYDAALKAWQKYEQAVKSRLESSEYRLAPKELENTVHDLERRGLLQYDGRTKRYDLHPVVRGVAAGDLRTEERDQYGQRLVDHFSRQSHNPYEHAETLDDLRNGLNLVRALLQMGHQARACRAYRGDMARALVFNLNANAEILALIRPFFGRGWNHVTSSLDDDNDTFMLTAAARSLNRLGQLPEALDALVATLTLDIQRKEWWAHRIHLIEIAEVLCAQNRLAIAERVNLLGIELGDLDRDGDLNFRERLDRFEHLARIGRWAEAQSMWQILDPMGRDWWRAVNRSRLADCVHARFLFWQENLTEEHLVKATQAAEADRNHRAIRDLHGLRGAWRLERREWTLAAASLQEAARMAREKAILDPEVEAGLVLAKFHLGQLAVPRDEVEQLARMRNPAHRLVATLWHALHEKEQARQHALAAYRWAWADGEPYVNRYELTKTAALLRELGVPLPNLPAYDAAKDEKLPWEAVVAAAIKTLRAEQEAGKSKAKPPDLSNGA
jgi:hypothetical protein